MVDLIESYRNLVDALLTHTAFNDGTDLAVNDFYRSVGPEDSKQILLMISGAQEEERRQHLDR